MDSTNTNYEKLPNKKEIVDVTWKEKRIKKWNTNDLCDWIKSIGLSEKWQQEMIEAIENIGCTGKDWLPIKNSKELQNSLDIKQPMLSNRVYREFKKVKKDAENVKKNNKPPPTESIAPKLADLEQPVMPQPVMQPQQQKSVIIQPQQQANVNYSGNNYQKPYVAPIAAAYEQPSMQQNAVIIQPHQQQQGNIIYAGNVNAGYPNNNIYYQIPAQQAQQPIIIVTGQPQNNYGTQQQQYTNVNTSRVRGVVEPYQDLRCLSFLACLLCGIPGIFALCFAANAHNAHERGDYDEYRRQQKNAKICIAISCVVGIFVFVMIGTGSMY